ncbi:hypothetical protein F2981_15515 [Sinorhizobium meliloti]|nr:hypothetical protein [Sinorhizobium meliloti]
MASEGEDRIQREYHDAPAELAGNGGDQPFGRLVDPAEVARACAYLSSAEFRPHDGSVICSISRSWACL